MCPTPRCPHFEYTELIDILIRTRGNKFKLVQHHCHYDLKKYNFTNRVVPIWNSFSNHVVSAETVNTFNNRLDMPQISFGWIKALSRSTVRLQNRSPWHREPQYSLVAIIHIDNVTY